MRYAPLSEYSLKTRICQFSYHEACGESSLLVADKVVWVETVSFQVGAVFLSQLATGKVDVLSR